MGYLSAENWGADNLNNTGSSVDTYGNLTVPAGCKLAVLLITGYNSGTTGYYSAADFVRIGSSGMTAPNTTGDASTSTIQGALYYLIDPPTGSQACTWDFSGSGTGTEKAQFIVAYYDDVVTGVRAHGGSGQVTSDPATTSSIGATSGDLIVGGAWTEATASGTWTPTNLTNRTTAYRNSLIDMVIGDTSATGSQTVAEASDAAGSFSGGIIAIAFIPSAGGSSITPTVGSGTYTGNSSPMNYTMTPRTA